MSKPQVPAAHNVLRILALLSTTDAPISATRIQRELDLPRSTTYHLLRERRDVLGRKNERARTMFSMAMWMAAAVAPAE